MLVGREIAQEGGKILSKVSPKLKTNVWENFVAATLVVGLL